MIAARDLRQRLPGLDRDVSVRFGRERKDHLGCVHRRFEPRTAIAIARKRREFRHFMRRIPANALSAVAKLGEQRSYRRKFVVDLCVVAFDERHRGRCLSGNQFAFARAPVLGLEGLAEFTWRVVHEGRGDEVGARAEMLAADLGELLRDRLVDVPVRFAFPQRLHRFRQRMDEGVHVRRVEIVLLVEGRARQHDVGIEAGRAHAEIEHRQQVELAFGGGAQLDLTWLGRAGFIVE